MAVGCARGARAPGGAVVSSPSTGDSAETSEAPTECSPNAARSALGRAKEAHERGDSSVARKDYRYACQCNVEGACLGLANSLAHDDDAHIDEAMPIYLRLCDEGQAGACTNAGMLYRGGRPGATRRLDKALALLEKACNMGVPLACAHLAVMYRHAQGVPRDTARALELNERACKADLAMGCNNLGDMLETGDGVSRNVERAKTLYEKVCETTPPKWLEKGETDSAFGCYSLALLYEKGLGAHVDKKKARDLLKRACNGHVKEACKALGNEPGHG